MINSIQAFQIKHLDDPGEAHDQQQARDSYHLIADAYADTDIQNTCAKEPRPSSMTYKMGLTII